MKPMITVVLVLMPALILAQTQFAIVIQPDNFPDDITWELFFRTNGQRIGSGTTSASGTLPDAEYLFRISDSFGDGICCGNGNGNFALRGGNVNFFTSDGQYGDEETVEFTLSGNRGTVVNGATPTTPVAAGEYSIDLVPAAGFDPTGLEDIVAALQDAADRWAEVIVGDLPDINGVDDLQITYDFSPIDGVSGTIGSAGPTRIRQGSLLPYTGQMTFDSADVGRLSAGQLQALFLHEMGHVLGIGTLWDNLGCSNCRADNNPRYNPNGQCPAAEEAYENLPGRVNGVQLNIELDGGGGTACGHFDELQFQSEVMTGFLTVNRDTQISEVSTMTIGTLQDMGYTVNFDAADEYTVPITALSIDDEEVIMDLSSDTDQNAEYEVDMTDDENNQEWGSIDAGDSNAGVVAGVAVGAAAVVGLGAVFVYRRRKGAGADNHVKLVETA